MIRILLIYIFVNVTCISLAQNKWVIDPSNSSIQFEVNHLMISSIQGRFDNFNATIFPGQSNSFKKASINAEIAVKSINTGNNQRDAHLLQSDFFEEKAFPKITFQNATLAFKQDNQIKITGELTIKGITKKISFEGEFRGYAKMWGRERAGFTASGKINRFDYAIKYNDTLDAGGLVVGEEVTFILNLEFIKQN